MKSLNKDVADLVRSPLGSASEPSISFTGDPNTGTFSPGADQLAASTGGSERLRITSTGKILVGAASQIPTLFPGLFQVNAPDAYAADFGRFTNDSFGAYISLIHGRGGSPGVRGIVQNGDALGVIDFIGDDGVNLNSIGAQVLAAVDGTPGVNNMPGRLVFSTTANIASTPTERMRITSTGNVGIGTSAPSSLLDILGGYPSVTSNSDDYRLRWRRSDGSFAGGLKVDGFHKLTFALSDAGGTTQDRMVINVSGNVGIGTASPTNKLDVSGAGGQAIRVATTDASGVNIARLIAQFTGGGGLESNVELRAGTAYSFLTNTTNTPLLFGTNSTERARIDSSGRLGLGISSPSSLLHLADAGNITVGTTTGTKIGTATTQKLGFYNATPVVQPAAVADATTAVDVITQLNDLLAKLRTLGIIAT